MAPVNIEQVNTIVDRKWQEQRKTKFVEMSPILDIVRKFVIKHKLVVYGGFALNEFLPPKDKFYDEYELPDYDCYSSNAKKHAIELANILHRKGYKYTEVRSAMHPGTFRVFSQFKSVADISQVDHAYYTSLVKISVNENPMKKHCKEKQVYLAPINLLKFGLHKELSHPRTSLLRWEKVFTRTLLFTKAFHNYHMTPSIKQSIATNSITDSVNQVLRSVIDEIKQMIRIRNWPIVGTFAMDVYMGNTSPKIPEWFSIFEVLTMDLSNTVDTLKKQLGKQLRDIGYELQTETKDSVEVILPKRVHVYMVGEGKTTIPLVTFYESNTLCLSVVEHNGYMIGSTSTILMFFYAYSILYFMHEPMLLGHISEIIRRFETWIDTSDKIDANIQLATECYGYEKTNETVRKDRWDNARMLFVYKPERDRHREKFKI